MPFEIEEVTDKVKGIFKNKPVLAIAGVGIAGLAIYYLSSSSGSDSDGYTISSDTADSSISSDAVTASDLESVIADFNDSLAAEHADALETNQKLTSEIATLLSEAQAGNNAALSTLTGKIGDVSAQIGSITSQVGTITGQVGSITDQVNNLNSENSSVFDTLIDQIGALIDAQDHSQANTTPTIYTNTGPVDSSGFISSIKSSMQANAAEAAAIFKETGDWGDPRITALHEENLQNASKIGASFTPSTGTYSFHSDGGVTLASGSGSSGSGSGSGSSGSSGSGTSIPSAASQMAANSAAAAAIHAETGNWSDSRITALHEANVALSSSAGKSSFDSGSGIWS